MHNIIAQYFQEATRAIQLSIRGYLYKTVYIMTLYKHKNGYEHHDNNNYYSAYDKYDTYNGYDNYDYDG